MLAAWLLISIALSGCCRKCPPPQPPKVVTKTERCMRPLPPELAILAKEVRIPDAVAGQFTLTVGQVRVIGALLSGLVDYIQVEYARCGKET